MIELDKAQKQSVYQLLQARNLEEYQPRIEQQMLLQLNPTESLKLSIEIADRSAEIARENIRERLTGRRW